MMSWYFEVAPQYTSRSLCAFWCMCCVHKTCCVFFFFLFFFFGWQVFAGFIVANLSDNWCSGLCIPDGFFHRMAASCSSCLPSWLRKPPPRPG